MDMPASNGWPALYTYHGKLDADIVKLLKASNGVQFVLTVSHVIESINKL